VGKVLLHLSAQVDMADHPVVVVVVQEVVAVLVKVAQLIVVQVAVMVVVAQVTT